MKTLKSKSPMARLCLVIMAFIGLYIWGCDQSVPEKVKTEFTAQDSTEISKADAKLELGSQLDDQGKYADALQNYLEALVVYEKLDKKNAIAKTYNLIGIIYFRQNKLNFALDYFLKSYKLLTKILENNPMDSICRNDSHKTLNNVGMVFAQQENNKKAILYYDEALKIAEKIGDKKSISLYCNNLGSAYRNIDDYQNSYHYLREALQTKKEIGDKEGESRVLLSIGVNKKEEHQFNEALGYFSQSMAIAQKINDKNLENGILQNLSETYAGMGNYPKAYEYHVRFKGQSDSLLNTEATGQMAEMATKYETEKKEQQIQVLNKDKEVQDERLGRQKITIIAIILFALIVIIVAIWFFRMYRTSRRKSIIIDLQKKEVEKQKGIVDEKNKEMTDSINYASRIQRAMLPKIADITSALPKSFVFYQPKDIVSGDFYWFQKVGDAIFIAAADCTGHGVPGALTSAFCNSALNDAIQITQDPAEMLSLVNNFVKSALRQSDGETKDGMDIALVKIKGQTLEYSAANRPIYVIRNGKNEVEEIKADKTAIGGFTQDDYRFKKHELSFEENDRFYLASDGFADQFGGPKGKKVTTKQFKEILVSLGEMPMEKQKEKLEKFMAGWMPDTHEQVDDFLVIGVRM